MAAASAWGELRSGQAESLHQPAGRRSGLPGGVPRRLAAGAHRRAPQRGAAGRRHPDRAGRRRGRSTAPPRALSRGGSTTRAARQQVLREVEGDPGHRGAPGHRRRGGGRAAVQHRLPRPRGLGAPPRPGLGAGGGSIHHPSPAGAHRRRRRPGHRAAAPSSWTRSVSPIDDDQDMAAALEPIAVRTDDEIGRLAHAFNAVQPVAVDVAAEQSTAAQEGHQRPVREPRPPQPGAHRPPDPAARPAGGGGAGHGGAPAPVPPRPPRDRACAATRRASSSWRDPSPGPAGRSPSKWSTSCAPRSARSRTTSGSSWARWPPRPCTGPPGATWPTWWPSSSRTPPSSRRRTAPSASTARCTAGTYQIVITDHGVGMRQEQLDELNEVLRDPPVTGLALGRALGCLVAARLAARHGITVRLRSDGGRGRCRVRDPAAAPPGGGAGRSPPDAGPAARGRGAGPRGGPRRGPGARRTARAPGAA